MEIRELFEKANEHLTINLAKSFEETASSDLGKIIAQINAYKYRASGLEQEIVEEIIYDLFISLQLSINGLYRHSFISTRCALELGIAQLKFKDDNFSYLLWKNNKDDISWSSFFNEERGVLSYKYLKLFKPNGSYEKVILSASSIYRECSEYVHGKYGYITELNVSKITFNVDLYKKSIEMCGSTIRLLNVLLCIRFGNSADQHYTLFENLLKEFDI